MMYEKPNLEVMKIKRRDVVCQSGLFGGNENDFHESGGDGNSTSTGGTEW